MVDVGGKGDTVRMARASGRVWLGHKAFELVRDNKMAKGDVLTTAKLAGKASWLPTLVDMHGACTTCQAKL